MAKHHHVFHWGRSHDIDVSTWAVETEHGAPDGMALILSSGSISLTTRCDIAQIDSLMDVLSRARADAVAMAENDAFVDAYCTAETVENARKQGDL